MRTDGVMIAPQRSAVCNMVLDGSGNLVGGVADMDIVQSIEPEVVWRYIHTNDIDMKSITKYRSSPKLPNTIHLSSHWTLTFHLMYSGR